MSDLMTAESLGRQAPAAARHGTDDSHDCEQ
jgi:hypothetical protein